MKKQTMKKSKRRLKGGLTKKIISGFLTTSLVISLCAISNTTTLATSETTQQSRAGNVQSLLNLKEQAPSELATAKNPYGYDKGVAFNLFESKELLYYGGWNSNNESKILNSQSIDGVNNFVKSPNTSANNSKLKMPSGTWNWVEAVAFDDSQSAAQDNKILFLSVEQNKKAYAWVFDYNNDQCTNLLELGNMGWIGTDYNQYSSTSLFSVVAGDFDGDGVDSLLVYTPLNLNNNEKDGCILYELTYKNNTLSKTNTVNGLLIDNYIKDQNNLTYKDKSYSEKNYTEYICRDKLSVSMQAGDFNGDSFEDLAVLSYSHKRNSDGTVQDYCPQLKICYGKKDFNFTNKKADETFSISSVSGDKMTFPMGASLAKGDYNADGCDDLFVVGVEAYGNKTSNMRDATVLGNKWYMHGFMGSLSNKMQNTGYRSVNSNAWFEDGFYASDYCYGETMAAGVALSGKTGPAMLFVAGSLYDVSGVYLGAQPQHKLTMGYFTSGDDGVTRNGESHVLSNTFMQSVQVGNFDENQADREQVVFIVGLKQSGQDDYYYQAGALWGTNFKDTTYSDNSTCYGPASSYGYTNLDDESSYIHWDKGDDPDEGLNCSFIGLDYDNDAVEAKYLDVGYMYTDPNVIAVLQAAPYFGDIYSSAPTFNATSYSITTSYSHSDSESDTLEGKVGFAAGGSVPFIASASTAIGIKGGFTLAYTSSYEEEYTVQYTAGAEDIVVITRTPMLVYKYDINGKEGWTGKTQMEISMPQAPRDFTLSVDEYNQYVTEYNKQLDKLAKGEKCNKLIQINKEENWLDGNEGNPYVYNHNGWNDTSIEAVQINKGNGFPIGKAGAVVSVNKQQGNTVTESFDATCGFYCQETLLFGSQAIANYGIDLGAEYEHGWGFADTSGDSTAMSFSVESLSLDKASPDVLSSYDFTWSCGSWKRNLGNLDSNGDPLKTMFLGYGVTNISSPPIGVKDLIADYNKNEGEITLSWTKPETPTNWPNINGYVVYQAIKDNNGSTKYEPLLKIEDANTTKANINKLFDNASINAEDDYSFMVKSYYNLNDNTFYSDKSNIATIHIPLTYTVNFDYATNTIDNITVLTQDNKNLFTVEVTDGDRLYPGMILNINAKAKDNYTIKRLTVTDVSTGETTEFLPTNNGVSISAFYQIKDNTVIKIETKKTVKEAVVEFSDKVMDGNTLAGTVSAMVDGYKITSGAIVSDPVTFTATPETGYVLSSWQVVADGETYQYATNDKKELILDLIGENINVIAVFEKTDQAYRTITVEQPDEGGKIALYDSNGAEMTPKENGIYEVAYNTEVTFIAIPNTGYVLKAWTNDAEGQTENQFTINVTDNITVGAVYKAPVKYSLTYNAQDKYGNTVTTTPNIVSGSAVAAGTEVTFNALAVEGYCIGGWKITKGSTTEEYSLDDQLLTEDTKTVVIDEVTKVEVSFVELITDTNNVILGSTPIKKPDASTEDVLDKKPNNTQNSTQSSTQASTQSIIQNNTNTSNTNNQIEPPQTGEKSYVLYYIMILFVAIGIVAITKKNILHDKTMVQ